MITSVVDEVFLIVTLQLSLEIYLIIILFKINDNVPISILEKFLLTI